MRVVRLWAELVARSEYRGGEQPRPLDEPSWQERRRELERQIEGATVSESVRRIASDRLYWLRCELDLAQGELYDAQPTRRLKDAVEILTRLINSEPRQWRYLQRLGEALGRLGRYREAAAAFQQALQIGGAPVKEDARWWSCTGLCLLASGDEKGYTRTSSRDDRAFDRNPTAPSYPSSLRRLVTSGQRTRGQEVVAANEQRRPLGVD